MLKKPWPFLAALPLRGDAPNPSSNPDSSEGAGQRIAAMAGPTGLVRHTAMAGCAHPAQPTAAP